MSIEDAVGPIIMGSFVLALIIEALMPRETQPRVRGWRILGIVFFIVNATIAVVFPLLIPGEWIAAHSLLPGMKLGIPGGFAVGFVAWSFIYYWYHRSEHRFDFMWRGLHQLHHSPRRMDVSGFPVSHPTDIIAQTFLQLGLLVWLLGLHPAAAALVGLYGAIAELVQHMNIRTPRWLEYIMQRPEAHQRHHEFGQHAGNYGDWPVWDKLLGTYRAPAEGPLPYGFADGAARRIGAMLAFVDVNRTEAPIVRHE